jgi:hypothetical protein
MLKSAAPRPARLAPAPAGLAVLEGGQESKNAHTAWQAGGVDKNKALRVTQLALFERCPKEWAARYIGGIKTPDTRASATGTLVHEVAEAFMRRELELGTPRFKEVEQKLLAAEVPLAEVMRMTDYLFKLQAMRDRVLAIEHEFLLSMVAGAMPVLGHMDLVLRLDEETISVNDHKTNRTYKPVDWWKDQLQPRMYGWAARQIWPGNRVMFKIGYVNLGRSVAWEITEQDDRETRDRFVKIWDGIQAGQATGEWEEKVSDACRWCPVKGQCATYQANFQNTLTSLGFPADI